MTITLLDKANLLCFYILPDFKLSDPSLGRLVDALLIDYKPESEGFEVTERGKVLCEALRSVPLPTQMWIVPGVNVQFPPERQPVNGTC